jgi:hypothetical protein
MNMIQKKVIASILYIILFISIAQPALAQESESKGKRQSPVQLLTTIIITAVAMKGLSSLKIP